MKILLKHNILQELRESRSIPKEILSKKLGISVSDYEKYENEDIEVDIGFAEKVAGIYKRNWSVFLLDNLQKAKIPRDNRTTENQSPTLHEKTAEAIEDANYIYEFVQGLESHTGLKIPKFEDIEDLNAEELAERIRSISGISIEEQEKFESTSKAFKIWRNFIERKGIFVSQYPLNPEDKIRAFSIGDHDRAVIVVNSSDEFSNRIFSLFHELCHILRKTSGICDLHNSQSQDVEVFCNQFAASFLAPSSIVKSYINSIGADQINSGLEYHSRNLAKKLRVSQLAIYRRFTTLGVINDRQYSEIHNRYLMDYFERRNVRQSDEGSTGGPNPYLIKKQRNGVAFSNTVFAAFNAGEISAIEASKALGVKANKFEDYRSITA